MFTGAISQSSFSPVPWLCLVTSSRQQAACSSSGVSLCYGETVQCSVVPCYIYSSSPVAFVNCWTCRYYWKVD